MGYHLPVREILFSAITHLYLQQRLLHNRAAREQVSIQLLSEDARNALLDRTASKVAPTVSKRKHNDKHGDDGRHDGIGHSSKRLKTSSISAVRSTKIPQDQTISSSAVVVIKARESCTHIPPVGRPLRAQEEQEEQEAGEDSIASITPTQVDRGRGRGRGRAHSPCSIQSAARNQEDRQEAQHHKDHDKNEESDKEHDYYHGDDEDENDEDESGDDDEDDSVALRTCIIRTARGIFRF